MSLCFSLAYNAGIDTHTHTKDIYKFTSPTTIYSRYVLSIQVCLIIIMKKDGDMLLINFSLSSSSRKVVVINYS